MSKEKIIKWALPALLLSCLTFELLPGSVNYYVNNELVLSDAPWNFFNLPNEGMASSCLVIAGMLTIVTIFMAMVAVCFHKKGLYRIIGWCSLAGGAFAAGPYMVAAEGKLLQPNVMVMLLLLGCWLLARHQDKHKDDETTGQPKGKRL